MIYFYSLSSDFCEFCDSRVESVLLDLFDIFISIFDINLSIYLYYFKSIYFKNVFLKLA